MLEVGTFAKPQLSELIAAVAASETVMITRRGRPVARPAPLEAQRSTRAALVERVRSLQASLAGVTRDDIL
ncbi:MAG: type II toxin-antitoxin system prevent-host-death family antitoxin [Rhodobacteraceae bacterium]|nr:type II toxin-antitoxin system prevent-host-death family antitoxin [Paracoccaceae bacterium]